MPGIVGRRVRNRGLTAVDKFSREPSRLYMYDNFQNQPQIEASAGFGNPVGTQNNFNILEGPSGGLGQAFGQSYYEIYNISTQAIINPTFSAAGLNVAYDQVNGRSIEIGFGGNSLAGHQVFEGPVSPSVLASNMGDTPGWFARLKFSIAVANGGNVQFGFRSVQTYTGTLTNYTDFYTLISNAGVIQGQAQVASGGNVVSVPLVQGAAIPNWANTETHEFRIETKPVPGGNPYTLWALYDGKYLQLPPYVWGSNLNVMPFAIITQNATLTGAVNLVEYEGGFLPQKI